jgi:formylglycine-generating enzyme required for sulfatase activity
MLSNRKAAEVRRRRAKVARLFRSGMAQHQIRDALGLKPGAGDVMISTDLKAVLGQWKLQAVLDFDAAQDPRLDTLRQAQADLEKEWEKSQEEDGVGDPAVLGQGTPMPAEAQLPPSLQRLAFRNGLAVRPDPDFHRDVDRLIQHLDRLIPQPPPREFVNSIGVKMVLVPAGSFWMGGSWQTQMLWPFYAGIYPVTQGQWQAVMGSNPSWFSRTGPGKDQVKGVSDEDLAQFPVENVSWDDVQDFLKRLNEREKSGEWVYCLPTEHEWEYGLLPESWSRRNDSMSQQRS